MIPPTRPPSLDAGRGRRRALAACGLAAGLALTFLAWIVPRLAAPGPSPPAVPAGGVPGYDAPLRGPEAALALLARGDGAASVERLNRLVDESLAHAAPAPLRPAQSWLLWCAAALVPDLRTTQDARRLLAGGRGICSDAVIVLGGAVRELRSDGGDDRP